MMSKKLRLHPTAIFFHLIFFIRQFFFPIVAAFIAFRGVSFFIFILILLGIFLAILFVSFLSWYRFTYQVGETELKIEHGVFIRKKRYISKNRIQSIDFTASIFHRMLGLVKVQIETASSGEGAEASLSAIKKDQAEWIREQLRVDREDVSTHGDTENNLLKETKPTQISFGRLFIAGSTSGSIGVLLGILLVGISKIEQFIPDDIYSESIALIISLSIVFIVFLAIILLLVLWLIGIAGTMIKYGNFTISKQADELYVTRGLIEKRQLTIPLKRIQAIGVKENLLRQPLGFVTIFAVVAGGSLDEGEDFPILFPLLKRSEVEPFLSTYLPDYKDIPTPTIKIPKRARKFYLLRSSFLFLVLSFVIGYFFPQLTLIPAVLLILSLFLGYLRYKDGGYHIENKRLMIRYRLFSKVTMMMYQKRIQSMEKRKHKIQAIQQLATNKISLIGSLGIGTHYTLKDLQDEDANQLLDWYSYRKKS